MPRPIRTLIAWIAAHLVAPFKRPAQLAEAEQPEPQRDAPDIQNIRGAQLQDHGGRAARRAARRPDQHNICSAKLARSVAHPREGPVLLGGPRIDGCTSWEVRAGPRGFVCWPALKAIAKSADRVVSWVDPWGEVVDLEVDPGRPGSGAIVLSTSHVRIEVRKAWAEIQITATAAEVEGVEAWAERELPRAMLWLLGVDARSIDELAEAGLRQRRIELCLDVAGWQLWAGVRQCLVSRAATHERGRSGSVGDGVDAGTRYGTPCSLSIYDKIAEIERRRGADKAALRERWREHGWADGQAVTRIELRIWGDALRLVDEDGAELDATHPGAAMDVKLLGVLWADGLGKHWLAEPRGTYWERLEAWERDGRPKGKGPRLRDEPMLGIWAEARAAGGCVEAVRLRRDVAAAQLAAVKRHALERLGRLAPDLEVLLDGVGDGAVVRRAVDELVREPGWDRALVQARARLGQLIQQGGRS